MMCEQVVEHAVRILPSPLPGVVGSLSTGGQQFERHWHDVYGFGFILSGAQKWRSGKGIVCGYEGDAICTNPGEVHDGEPLGGKSREWFILSVEVDAMRALSGDRHADVEFSAPVMHDVALVHLFARLHEYLRRPCDAPLRLAFEEAMSSVCTLVAARHSASKATLDVPSADMHRVRERLGDDLRHPPTLAQLAELVGLSRYQTLRRFTSVYGMPPHAWLRNARVERARRLIGTGMSLSAVAQTCGFADQSHMTRCFKRQFGMTPGAVGDAVYSGGVHAGFQATSHR